MAPAVDRPGLKWMAAMRTIVGEGRLSLPISRWLPLMRCQYLLTASLLNTGAVRVASLILLPRAGGISTTVKFLSCGDPQDRKLRFLGLLLATRPVAMI